MKDGDGNGRWRGRREEGRSVPVGLTGTVEETRGSKRT